MAAKSDLSDTERGLTTKCAVQFAVSVGPDPYSEKRCVGLDGIRTTIDKEAIFGTDS